MTEHDARELYMMLYTVPNLGDVISHKEGLLMRGERYTN